MNAKQRKQKARRHKQWAAQILALFEEVAKAIETGELTPKQVAQQVREIAADAAVELN